MQGRKRRELLNNKGQDSALNRALRMRLERDRKDEFLLHFGRPMVVHCGNHAFFYNEQ